MRVLPRRDPFPEPPSSAPKGPPGPLPQGSAGGIIALGVWSGSGSGLGGAEPSSALLPRAAVPRPRRRQPLPASARRPPRPPSSQPPPRAGPHSGPGPRMARPPAGPAGRSAPEPAAGGSRAGGAGGSRVSCSVDHLAHQPGQLHLLWTSGQGRAGRCHARRHGSILVPAADKIFTKSGHHHASSYYRDCSECHQRGHECPLAVCPGPQSGSKSLWKVACLFSSGKNIPADNDDFSSQRICLGQHHFQFSLSALLFLYMWWKKVYVDTWGACEFLVF
ncbi:CRACD-like protein [Macaca nemestrina]|uniref:CRACD-like protein n=1 Tax=Macaca nemestrina TaxID=9545 RepID=UPI0039B94387